MTTPNLNHRRPFVWQDGTGRPPLLMWHSTGGDEHDLLPLATLPNRGPTTAGVQRQDEILQGASDSDVVFTVERVDSWHRTPGIGDHVDTAGGDMKQPGLGGVRVSGQDRKRRRHPRG